MKMLGCIYDYDFFAEGGQLFESRFGDPIHVFYSDAAAFREKDLGFDSQRHARLQFDIAA